MKSELAILESLLAQYVKDESVKEGELVSVRQKIATLREILVDAGRLNISHVAVTEPLKDHAIVMDKKDSDSLVDAFFKSGLTNSVLMALSEPEFRGVYVSPPQVREFLLSHGFKPIGKNFNVSVGTTMNRLADQDRILREKVNGKTLFKAKQ